MKHLRPMMRTFATPVTVTLDVAGTAVTIVVVGVALGYQHEWESEIWMHPDDPRPATIYPR